MRKFFSLITALVLCTAMWGATYKTFYKVEGALYQGINVDFTTNKNMFVPNGATVTYSTFDGKPADWWANGKQKKTNVSYITIPDLADANYYKYQIKNYTGYDAQDPKIDYIYGTSSGDYLLRAGSGTMYMMSMANAYAVCTEDSKTPTNVGKYTVVSRTESGSTDYVEKYGTYMMYGTDFTHATYGAVKAYDMIVDNPGEMYIDYIVLPIFGYPKDNTTTIDKMIPEGKELTITLYPIDLTLSDKGVYSYTRKTTPITTVTATKENFNQGDKVYNGTVKFDLSNNPLLISGDFVARLTWDDGCNFGLITDNYNLQNYTTWYYCADKKVHYIWNGGGRNASISYHAMFPVLEKKDTKTALEFTYEGGGDEVAIKSNINPSSKDFSIDFGGADWISLDSLRYTTEGKYVAKETVYVVFKTEANEGEAREATITLKHHGKELTYTVSQEAAPVEPTYLYLKAGEVDYMKDGAVVYLYSWGGSSDADWSKFEQIENETTAKASMMLDRTGLKIVRFASGTTTPSWQGTIWNQTGDISVSSDFPEKVDMIELSAWDGATAATWSKYGGAVEKPKHDYTITVYLPAFCDDIAAYADSVRVMGGFDDWSNGIWMEEKIDEDFNEYWYAEIKDVEEDTEFKLRFGTDADWKVQVQLNGANMANEAFGETTDIVLHYDGEGYGFAACAAPVARKEFVFVAGEAADSDPAMFAITWGKDGSSEQVKMEKQEEALYAADILATVDSVVLVRCATGATEIIWGEGTNVWNQTANYALCDTMYFGEWTEEGLFTLTCEAPKPVETKYYAKNNWNGGEWSWKEMAKKEDLYVLDSVVFGGTGVNINTKEEDADAKWFDLKKMKYNEQDTIQALDTVRFELAISEKDTVLTAILLGRPAPVARKEFVFVAGEAADSDPAMFAITWGKDGSSEQVKMEKQEEALYAADILATVDSVVLVRCATGATEIIWGEGTNVWNQTANYALCDTMYFGGWTEEGLFTLTCEAPKPVETKYYAKNNWNNGDWTWKEMTKVEDLYVLDSVIFGGTGVNINTKEDDTDAKWFALKDMTYVGEDTIQALDTVRFELSVSDKDTILTAIKLGRPAPVARKEFVFVAGEAADSDPAMFAITWGKDGSSEQVKMEKQEEALYAADILATVDSVVLVRCATGATEIIWGEGTNVWNQTANYALCDTMYFGEWTEEGLFTLTCEAPKPVETKYYAKNNWNGATEWTWLEMSATDQENFYMLDSVVFGGTGVNINDKADDADALYFAADAITVLDGLDGLPGPIPPKPQGRDTIPYAPAHSGVVLEAPQLLAGDTIKLFFNAADSTLKAFITGRPEQPQPAEVKYYVTGNAALVGEDNAWKAQAIEMIDSTYTFTELAAGEYEMKITNGAWDPEGQSWGSAALSEKCSAGVGDKDGNIHFIVETANDVTVSIANGSVTVTGTFKQVATGITVNVTVPEGTPACFFYGEMSGNTFVEMTKVDETHYTIDFPKATSIGWGYKFVWENGNWSTCNADPEGDIKIEPVNGVITVEVKAWATAPGTEYKYTTYTEWQVKFGPAWEWVNMTKQEDGTFTVEAVWGNTGINIASGENPIKKDWYPLGDPALTVAEGVVEGGNVVITLTVVDDETVALNVKKQTATNLNNVKAQDGKRYNILGQPVNETYRGIVIMNGQTYLQ